MDEWMDGSMDGWIDSWMDQWICRWVCGYSQMMVRQMDGNKDEQLERQKKREGDGWTVEWIYNLIVIDGRRRAGKWVYIWIGSEIQRIDACTDGEMNM